MKKAILIALKQSISEGSDGAGVSSKVLRKATELNLQSAKKEDTFSFSKDDFTKTVQYLIDKGKIGFENDCYALIQHSKGTKRKAESSEHDGAADESTGSGTCRQASTDMHSEGDAKKAKKSKKEKNGSYPDTDKEASSSSDKNLTTATNGVHKPYVTKAGVVVEELWKNGEKFWREQALEPEYLRKNPDQ